MKFRPVLICLLLCNNILMHAVQFDKGLQPFIKVYSVMSVLPWQKMFNVGFMGALGWFGWENMKLKKSLSECVTNKSLDKSVSTGVAQYAAANLKAEMGHHFVPFGRFGELEDQLKLRLTKEEADTTYLAQSETNNFVKKTKEEKDNLAQAVVSLTLPIFDQQFVNINTFNALTDQVKDCATKEELVAVQKLVDNCVTREDFKEAFQEQMQNINTNFQNFQKMLTQYQEESKETNNRFNKFLEDFSQYKKDQDKTNSDIALTLKHGLDHINTTVQGFASNQDFILRLASNVAGLLTREDDAHNDNQVDNANH